MTNAHASIDVWTGYIAALNSHDVEAVLRCVDEQIVYDERPMTMARPITGQAMVGRYWTRVFGTFPDLRINVTTLDAGSRLGFSESEMTGTRTPRVGRARSMHVRVACAFETSDGLLTHERLYWDRANTLRQFGVVGSLVGVLSRPVWRPDAEAAGRVR